MNGGSLFGSAALATVLGRDATMLPELAYRHKTKAFRPSLCGGKLSTCEEWGVGDLLYWGERWGCSERLEGRGI